MCMLIYFGKLKVEVKRIVLDFKGTADARKCTQMFWIFFEIATGFQGKRCWLALFFGFCGICRDGFDAMKGYLGY